MKIFVETDLVNEYGSSFGRVRHAGVVGKIDTTTLLKVKAALARGGWDAAGRWHEWHQMPKKLGEYARFITKGDPYDGIEYGDVYNQTRVVDL